MKNLPERKGFISTPPQNHPISSPEWSAISSSVPSSSDIGRSSSASMGASELKISYTSPCQRRPCTQQYGYIKEHGYGYSWALPLNGTLAWMLKDLPPRRSASTPTALVLPD